VKHIKGNRYQADYRGEAVTVEPGKTLKITNRLFAGAKEVEVLDQYRDRYNIPLFDRAIDFGWFYFLTKPIFHLLNFIYAFVGNFGVAILALTVMVKLVMYPLANKSYTSMSQMKLLMPKVKELQERYGDDKMKMNTELMALYKREKINPMSGCLPILVQIPVFFSLYKVLFVTIEMRHAPFFGWIQDLSAADPTNVFTLFGLVPWDAPHFLHIGIWPLIMTATMVIQQRLNPKPADPVQATVIQYMPFIFLFLFANFPAGLVVYWAWNNTLSIVQQRAIQWKLEHKKKAA
jgi:YidC/Oxa1 family membrane protein insertase